MKVCHDDGLLHVRSTKLCEAVVVHAGHLQLERVFGYTVQKHYRSFTRVVRDVGESCW